MARFDNDPPCDFLTYLEWRLGEDGDATARLLGEWLSSYKSERGTGRSPLPLSSLEPAWDSCAQRR